jgi:hypothetical protein
MDNDLGSAAYVSASRLNTLQALFDANNLHTADPINPHPPVTKMFTAYFSRQKQNTAKCGLV